MPPLKSKKTGKTWNDAKAFYNDQVAANPDLRSYSPDELWGFAQSDPNYESHTDTLTQFSGVPKPTEGSLPMDYVKSTMIPSLGREAWSAISGIPRAGKALLEGAFHGYDELKEGGPVNMIAGRSKAVAEAAGAIAKDIGDFYGGGNFMRNAYDNPGRVGADAASLLAVGGGAAMKAGKAGSTLNQAGRAATTVANAVDPLSLINEGVKAAFRSARIPEKLYRRSLDPQMRSGVFDENKLQAMTREGLAHDIPIGSAGDAKVKKAVAAYTEGRKKAVSGRTTDIPPDKLQKMAVDTGNDLKEKVGAATGSKSRLESIDRDVEDFLSGQRPSPDGSGMIPYEGRDMYPNTPVFGVQGNPAARRLTEEGAAGVVQAHNQELSDFYQRQHSMDPKNLQQERASVMLKQGIDKKLRDYLDNVIGDFPVDIVDAKGNKKTVKFKESGRTTADLLDLADVIEQYTNVPFLDKIMGKTAWSTAQGVKTLADPTLYSTALTLRERVLNPEVMSRIALAIKGGPRSNLQKATRFGQRAARVTDERPKAETSQEYLEGQLKRYDEQHPATSGLKRY